MLFQDGIASGNNPPEDINVVIEISRGSNIKYELDFTEGLLYVDRVLSVDMIYPFNYGLFLERLKILTLESSRKIILMYS